MHRNLIYGGALMCITGATGLAVIGLSGFGAADWVYVGVIGCWHAVFAVTVAAWLRIVEWRGFK